MHSENKHVKEIAIAEARSNFNKDQAIRLWATKHGGVYVPINERTPPNPSLSHISDREIIKPNGDTLTLMNPAYIIRQMFDEFPDEYGVVGRIVSLRPLNPNNAPDEWERKALLAFEKGEKERLEFTEIKGEEYLRLIQPMITNEGCLKCHAFQGYHVGDVRGGVGVSIKMAPLVQEDIANRNILFFNHFLILSFGLIGIWLASRRLKKSTAEQITANETIKAGELKFRTIADFTYDWEYWVKNDNSLEYISASCERITGYSVSEFMANNNLLAEIIVAEDKEMWEKHRLEFGSEILKLKEIQFRIQRKDGETVWLEHASQTVIDEHGVVHGYRTSNRDITERKQAEKILAAQKLRLDYILYGTNVGTWEWNVQTGEAIFNERWAAIIGYTLDELAPVTIDTWTKLTHPDDLKRSGELLKKHFNGELDYYECEARMRHKNGSWVWVLDRGKVASLTADHKPLLMAGTHQDITKRKQAENSLRESEERFRHMFEQHKAVMLQIDPDSGRIVDANTAAQNFYGYPHEVLTQMSIQDINTLPPEEVAERRQEAIHENLNYFVFPHRLASGEIRTVEVHSSPIEIKGKPALFTIVHDITYREKAEQERLALEAQLRHSHRLEAIGTMVGGVAHEFNNALQSLFLYAGMVKDGLPDDKAVVEDFNGLMKTANDAKKLVEQVMLISSMDPGNIQPLKLSKLISDAIELEKVTSVSDVKIELVLDKDCPAVQGDEQQLRQVLDKVIDNAILSMETEGILSINLKYIASDGDKADQAGIVQLTIKDTGAGMTEETLNQAFNPFFTTREIGQGKGFGLPIVYNLLQNMGASISATSALGKGSSFLLEFPVKDHSDA